MCDIKYEQLCNQTMILVEEHMLGFISRPTELVLAELINYTETNMLILQTLQRIRENF